MTEEIIKIPNELKNRHLGQDLVEALTAPTPKEYILSREVGGGRKANYVAGHNFIQKLNECFGFLWSLRLSDEQVIDCGEDKDLGVQKKQIVVKAELEIVMPGKTVVIEHPDGTRETTKYDPIKIVKSQYGGSEVKRYAQDSKNYKKGDIIDFANDYKGAGTDAMKKSATEFGIFLDVYGASEVASEDIKKISSTQVDAFFLRANKAGMNAEDAEKWCKTEYGKEPKELDPMTFMSSALPKLMQLGRELEAKDV